MRKKTNDMQKMLNIGSMKWPKASATRGFGFIGKRGSGKSYGAGVFTEELFDTKIPFVVFDPIDVWWGLKVAADGKGKGLPIVVFGKEHADVQLDRSMGSKIAEAVVKHNISCVISTFRMNKTEMREVVADFSERLLQINNTPRQVIIEEAHEFVPQRVQGAMARCFSAVEALLVMGRNRGIGVTLLNQRMATLNKDLLTQIDVLVAFRSVGPQDRKAFRDWVEVHHVESDEKFDEFMRSVPSLPTGEAWVWSPEFLEKFERVKFRKRHTFHPDREKLGMEFKMPEIKQGDIQEFIDAFSKKPEPKNPQVESMKKLLSRTFKPSGTPDASHQIGLLKSELRTEYKRGYGEGEMMGFDKGKAVSEKAHKMLVEKMKRFLMRMHGNINDINIAIELLGEEVKAAVDERTAGVSHTPVFRPSVVRKPEIEEVYIDIDRNASKPEQKILNAIAWMNAIGIEQPSKDAVALIAKFRSTSGGYQNNLSKLRVKGFIEYPTPGHVALTLEGKQLAETPDITVTSNEEFHRRIFDSLSNSEKNVLRPLLETEREMSKDELAALTPYQPTSGGYQNILSTLRTLGLIDYPKPGRVVATPIMFPFGI